MTQEYTHHMLAKQTKKKMNVEQAKAVRIYKKGFSIRATQMELAKEGIYKSHTWVWHLVKNL